MRRKGGLQAHQITSFCAQRHSRNSDTIRRGTVAKPQVVFTGQARKKAFGDAPLNSFAEPSFFEVLLGEVPLPHARSLCVALVQAGARQMRSAMRHRFGSLPMTENLVPKAIRLTTPDRQRQRRALPRGGAEMKFVPLRTKKSLPSEPQDAHRCPTTEEDFLCGRYPSRRPVQRSHSGRTIHAVLDHYTWRHHCGGLFQMPIAA